MKNPPVILDVVTRLAPLGLRFGDPATGQAIGGGLSVVAYPPAAPWQRIQGVPNPSGIYVFHHLPGLQSVEWGTGDEDFWKSPPARKSFLVEVQDSKNHFLPCVFEVEAPTRGVYTWQAPPDSLPEPAGMVPLYSSSTRPIPPGFAVIRADLQEPSGSPAASALLEAFFEDHRLGQGLADDRGQIALVFPYPDLPDFTSSSGGISGAVSTTASVPLTDQTWQIDLRVFYQWAVSPPAVVDLYHLLSQAPARLWKNLSPAQLLPPQTLHYGNDLIIKSDGHPFVIVTQP